MAQVVKIFEMNDGDWWAGTTREEVVAAYMAEHGITAEEAEGAHELSDQAMDDDLQYYHDGDHLQYYHDGDRREEAMTFREGLALRISEGEKFPCLFATKEF